MAMEASTATTLPVRRSNYIVLIDFGAFSYSRVINLLIPISLIESLEFLLTVKTLNSTPCCEWLQKERIEKEGAKCLI